MRNDSSKPLNESNPVSVQTQPLPSLGSLKNSRILVVGLGRFQGGVAVSRWLAGQGAQVTVTDRAHADTLQASLASLEGLNIKTQLGGHDTSVLTDIDLAIINPAVNKRRSDFFNEIIKREIPWTTEINLFCQRCPATVIGVTGTFGKSTTCAILAHVLSHQLVASLTPFTNVHLGGNIGRSLLPLLGEMLPSDLVILELSSAQLEDLPTINWQPDLAIITNLSPQHLDRHGTFERYALAKRNILGDGHLKKGIVLGPLDGETESMFTKNINTPRSRIIRPAMKHDEIELCIPGAHNQTNASTALSACQLLGLGNAPIRETLASFPGLPHRLEHIGTIEGVDYYNDSKSTAPTATLSAVQSLDRPIIAIVGGQQKPHPLTDWAKVMTSKCRVIICIGESGPEFAQAIMQQCALLNEPRASARADLRHPNNGCEVKECDSLKSALLFAREVAIAGDAVLFSPGAPSFDQYNNYEHRGGVFVENFRAMK